MEGILERFDPVALERNPCSLVCDFCLELLLIFEENCDELCESGVE